MKKMFSVQNVESGYQSNIDSVRYVVVINCLLHANAQNMAEEFNPEPVSELLIKCCIICSSVNSVTLHIHLICAILIEETGCSKIFLVIDLTIFSEVIRGAFQLDQVELCHIMPDPGRKLETTFADRFIHGKQNSVLIDIESGSCGSNEKGHLSFFLGKKLTAVRFSGDALSNPSLKDKGATHIYCGSGLNRKQRLEGADCFQRPLVNPVFSLIQLLR